MDIEIVTFPETRVAVIEHQGPPAQEHQSVMRLIAWRKANRMPPSDIHRSYGLHYNDPFVVPPEEYRVDLCVSVTDDVPANEYGVINKTIPEMRCARARHFGSRHRVTAAEYLYREWLPHSGETMADFPIIFHYVNVGPGVEEADMITDIYLPLAAR